MLMYVILWQVGGLSGWGWFWVVFAGLLDLAHSGGGWTRVGSCRAIRPARPGRVSGAKPFVRTDCGGSAQQVTATHRQLKSARASAMARAKPAGLSSIM